MSIDVNKCSDCDEWFCLICNGGFECQECSLLTCDNCLKYIDDTKEVCGGCYEDLTKDKHVEVVD